MSLHGLRRVTIGVPEPDALAAFYCDFGLEDLGGGRFASGDGGEQLHVVAAPTRRVVELRIGADDADDLARVARNVTSLGVDVSSEVDGLSAVEPVTGVRVVVEVASRVAQSASPAVSMNAPGAVVREGARSPAFDRTSPVRPRKLGHVVLGSTDAAASRRFFTDGIGFKVSDEIAGTAAFLRCSTDHHNLLVQRAPVSFLHHTSWQVDDVDEIGRGAQHLLEADASRHVWGLGRHFIGSNFFWYFRDPAGNFAEYYSDLDVIVDDELWKPEDFADRRALYAWGPPVPSQFLKPDDLAELMAR